MHPVLRAMSAAAAATVMLGAADPAPVNEAGQARIEAAPCEHLPEHRQFDFWIGEWDVLGPEGRKVGGNSIRKMPGGCVLLESWSSVAGAPGASINYYDPSRRKWVQIWVDARASVLRIEGELRDGAMRLAGEHVARDGGRERFRGAWTPLPDGRVRQYLEQSKDGGRSWYVWFDGLYNRRAE